MSKRITFGVNETGHALGEAHHRAKLTDEDVELIRDIYEEGMCGYLTLARVWNVDKATIRDIVTYRRRASTPAEYRTADATKRKPLPISRLTQLGIDFERTDEMDDFDQGH